MQDKVIRRITVSIMFIGFALSLVQFLYNRSLWLDEAMLSLNIINRDYAGLLEPLEYTQAAPIGFLYIEKLFSGLVPDSEYSLRLFPLWCFWASIYLFYKLAGILVKDSKAVLPAVSLFCLNASLVYYSSEVKQYMTDVFVSLFFYYLLLKKYKNERNKFFLLGLFGIAGIFLSNIFIIISGTVFLYLIIDQIKNKKKNLLPLVSICILWTGIFCFYYVMFIYHHPGRQAMLAYWSDSFMPLNITDISFWDFCFYKIKMVFGSLLSFGALGLIPFLFFIIGLCKLLKDKNRKMLWLLLFPVLLQLLFSVFKLYPFDLRLILYQAGFLMIIISIGVRHVLEISVRKTKKSGLTWILLLFPAILLFELLRNYPVNVEEIKKSLRYVSDHIKPNETVYIYYGSIPAYTYYVKTGKINFKNKIVFGHAYRNHNSQYIEEIKRNKERCWLLFSHIYNNESDFISKALGNEYKEELSYKTVGSETYLYKLSSR